MPFNFPKLSALRQPMAHSLCAWMCVVFCHMFLVQSAHARSIESLTEALRASVSAGDILSLDAGLDLILTEHTHGTIEAITQSPWGNQLTDDLIEKYILPLRVTGEPLENWRATLRKELVPIIKHKQAKTFLEAASLIRHWVNSQALPGASHPWDLSPFALRKAGQGRCEELGILFICAARAVGIPARVAYVPMWRGSDSNHMWVEVWDGNTWLPFSVEQDAAPAGTGWFLPQTQYAGLVLAKGYGKAPAHLEKGEELLHSDAISFTINRTALYTTTGTACLEAIGNTSTHTRLKVYVFNSGRPRSLYSKKAHDLCLTLGTGTYLVSAETGDAMIFDLIRVIQNEHSRVRLNIPQNDGILGLKKEYTTSALRELERQGHVPPQNAYAPTPPSPAALPPLQTSNALLAPLSSTDRFYARQNELKRERVHAQNAWRTMWGNSPKTAEQNALFERYVYASRIDRENFSHWQILLRNRLDAGHASTPANALEKARHWATNLRNLPPKGSDSMLNASLSLETIVRTGFVTSLKERLLALVAALRVQGVPAKLSYERDIFNEPVNPYVEMWDGQRWVIL